MNAINPIVSKCAACGAKNRIPAEKQHLRSRCGRCGRPLGDAGAGTVLDLDDQGFARVISESRQPVLVDFYSPACGPCRILAPVIDAIARSFAGRLLVAKLDTSRYQVAASRFQIRGVPTLLFFKNGRMVDQIVGAAPQGQIEQRIRAIL